MSQERRAAVFSNVLLLFAVFSFVESAAIGGGSRPAGGQASRGLLAARRLLRCVFEFWFIVNALNCASYGEPDVRPAGRPDGRVRGHTQSGGDTHRRLSREASDQRERLVHIRAEARTGTRAVAGGRVFGVAHCVHTSEAAEPTLKRQSATGGKPPPLGADGLNQNTRSHKK